MPEPTWDSILIAGERYRLEVGATTKVVTYEDPGGLSFERRRAEAMARLGSNLYGDRKGKPATLDALREVVTQVVLHTDLTTDSPGCFDVLVARGLSTHFMIDWDGTIYQGVDVLHAAYHAGDANDASVGIDLNNLMLNLEREPDAPPHPTDHPRFGDMSQKEFKRPKSERMTINGGEVRAYGYTDAQYTALIALLKVLVKVLPGIKPFVPLDEKSEIIPNVLEDPGFVGIVGHWHISPSRWDPGPGFDWARVYHGLASEHNAFPIELEEGVNVATLLEPDKVKRYAEEYYANTEGSEHGGWYPLGRNQQWHGGVHLYPEKAGGIVKAMFDGVLVAGRMGRRPCEMGDNSFLLLRHEVDIPTRKKDDTRKLTFYSLYMHLAYEDVSASRPESSDWVRELHRTDAGKAEEAEEAMEGGLAEEAPDEEEPKEAPAAKGKAAPAPAEEEEDEALGRGDSGGAVEEQAWLEMGKHLQAMKRGEVALIEWKKNPVRVTSGEVLGRVGEFGPPGEWIPTLHVEVFAPRGWKEAIDLGVHGRSFFELEADLDGDLFVDTKQVLSLFESSAWLQKKGSLVRERLVDPLEIEVFFHGGEETRGTREWLRKAIARHVSEWSDQVDWVVALSKAEDWQGRVQDIEKVLGRSGIFRGALRRILPFVWLTKEVAEHVGLPVDAWDGVLYHFHPIHFLMWLTYHSSQRIQVISRGLTEKQIKARLKKEAELKKKGQLKESDVCEGAAVLLDDLESTTTEEVLREWWEESEQGDWQITRDEEGV